MKHYDRYFEVEYVVVDTPLRAALRKVINAIKALFAAKSDFDF